MIFISIPESVSLWSSTTEASSIESRHRRFLQRCLHAGAATAAKLCNLLSRGEEAPDITTSEDG